jgi:hypothetical protein
MASGGLPEGSGALVLESIANPAAGSGAQLICPPGQRRLVHSINFILQTDATAIGRYAFIARTNGPVIVQGYVNTAAQTASQTFGYAFQAGGSLGVRVGLDVALNSFYFQPLPDFNWWWSDLDFWIRVQLMQAADQLLYIRVLYERWLAN